MSQASELLNGLSGDDIIAPVSVAEKEHVVVGEDRFIRVPDSLMRLGVQHDKDIETVTFDCPRHWGKHDLSSMQIYINYVLPNGEDGRCPVSNLSTIGATMCFDWTISDYVTQYNGKISFLICAVTVDAEGNEALHWNSELNQECYISEGLECRESTIHKYPDIVTHLLTRMKEVEAIATPEAMQTYTDTWLEANRDRILAEIEAKGAATLDTIPADYTETHSMANESVRTKADAIVCTAQGELIAVSDSSDDHIRNLRVFGKTEQVTTTGKNLFDVSKIVDHASLINIDGDVLVIAPATSTAISTNKKLGDLAPLLEVGGTYILTFDTTGTSNYIYLEGENRLWTSGDSLTVTQIMLDSTVLLYASGVSTIAKISNLMIRSATTDETYEVYSGGIASPSPTMTQPMTTIENPNVSLHGKNLIDCPDITLDEIDEYYHTFNTGFEPIVGETYTLSMDVMTDVFPFAINIGCGQYAYDADMTPKVSGSYAQNGRVSLTFVWRPTPAQIVNGYTKLWIRAPRYSSPTTFKSTVTNVQLELGSNATGYEPYREKQLIDVPYILNGIPVTSGGNYTDTNGQQWICDEIDFERGVYIRRIGEVVIDGTVAPTVFSPGTNGGSAFGFNYSYIGIDDILRDRCPKLCDKLLPMPDATIASWKLCEIGRWGFNTDGSADNFLIMNVGEFESAEAVQTWLTSNPITFQYILRTPIETPLTAEELEVFKALKTNYLYTTVLNDAGANMELAYNVDTKTYVDNGIKKSVTDVLEAIENGHY